MGDISIIARRLPDANNNYVQYGWSGNGGYFKNVGMRLMHFYQSPELVDYLFSLGEIKLIGAPHSEKGGYEWWLTNEPTGTPHSLGKSETEIFSKLAFVDYGYFFDTDNKWYYIDPDAIRIKIPFDLIYNNLDEDNMEFEYIKNVVEKKVCGTFIDAGKEIQPVRDKLSEIGKTIEQVKDEVVNSEYPINTLYKEYRFIYNCFDNWCVIECDEEGKEMTGCKIMLKQDKHIETIYW